MRRKALLLMATIAMISCDDTSESIFPAINTYPMNVGNEWIYDRQVIIKKFETATSTQIIGIDTLNFTVRTWIEKDTVLNDTIRVKMFKSDDDEYNFKAINYSFIDNEGLKNYAYDFSSGSTRGFARTTGNYIPSIDFDIHMSINDGQLRTGELMFEDKPTLSIAFPLNRNSKWTFRPRDGQPVQVDKKVIGIESLNINGQRFNCFIVDRLFSNNQAYDGIKFKDWISEMGLIKSSLSLPRSPAYNVNAEILFYGESTETLTLKSLELK